MKKEKLLVFGGTFDPPHKGHISILKNAIERVKPDKTLVIPAFLPPHKAAADTNGELRLEMCKVFLPLDNSVCLDDTELIRGGKSYTIDTVEVLQKKYPNHRIYLVVGSDMLLYFEKWQSWEKLLKKVCIVCQNRTDTDIQKVLEYTKFLREHGGRIIFCKKEIVEMSSTEIRKMVANGKDVNTFLQRETQKIIKENNLYV